MPHSFGTAVGIDAIALGTSKRAAIHYRAGGGTVAVDAVGAGAEHGHVFSRYFFGAGQGELLVASADAAITNSHGHLAAGDQTDA